MSPPASATIKDPNVNLKGVALPDGWRWVRLGDVCSTTSGGTPSRGVKAYYGGSIAWVKSGELNDGEIYSTEETITEEGLTHSSAKLFPAGTLLIALYGATVGKLGILEINAATNQAVCAIFPRDSVDRDYLFFYLLRERDSLLQASFGGAQPNISQDIVRSIEVALPLKSEQKRIAAILKEKMSAVDRARAATEAQQRAAKDLPAAYMRSVFASSHARQWTKKRIGDVALLIQNGIYKTADHYGHGHPFLRMYNVPNDSWLLNLDRLALVNLEGKEENIFALNRGDLLISRVNSFELVGKCAWVNPDAEGFVFENMLIRVQLDSSVNSLFVAQQMATDAVRKQIESVAKRAIGQASINSADIRSIEIALPSVSVQERISNELSARVTAAKQALKAINDELSTINKLPAALLRQALTGRL